MVRESLACHAADKRFRVNIHKMHFAMSNEQGRQVQVVGIAGPEDAKPRSSRCGRAGQEGRKASAMLGERLPVVPAGRIEGDLAPGELIHESCTRDPR